jgi:threonylcarbamoyladenosine tRNA methylthiotransferase MtaB
VSNKFVHHFHIPLQSGSNVILKSMKRRYLKELYVERVNLIRQKMPDCCIGVDVIVGFPGETEDDFLETYTFLNELDISYLHVFTYSERPDTLAIKLEHPVPQKERSKRSKMLRSLSEKKRRYFYQQFEGKSMEVLFEKDIEGGKIHGFTGNYIRVATDYSPEYINQIKLVSLNEVGANGIMQGELELVDKTEKIV